MTEQLIKDQEGLSLIQFINLKMCSGSCSSVGRLGECPSMDFMCAFDDGENLYSACLSIWDDNFNDAAAVVQWFLDAGAREVVVSHILHDTMNYDRFGRCSVVGGRNWLVHFHMTEDRYNATNYGGAV